MQIIDNFLDKESFEEIQNLLMGSDFDWYFSDVITSDSNNVDDFQFCHSFYRDGSPGIRYRVIEPLIQKIAPFALIGVKANLLTKTNILREYGYHIDVKRDNVTTAVFYINTCNGYTLFRDGSKVESKANRLVIFDAQMEHTGSSCTDKHTRVVINLNYFK